MLGQVALSAVFGEKDLRREAVGDRLQAVGKRGGLAAWGLRLELSTPVTSRAILPGMGKLISIHEHLLHVRAGAGWPDRMIQRET